MRSSIRKTNIFLILLLAISPGIASARTWTDTGGDTIEAEYGGVKGKNVILIIGGQKLAYPINAFSAEDRRFIREQMDNPAAGEKPLTEMRLWTDTNEQRVKGALMGMEGEQVVLRLVSGRVAKFPISDFIESDQEIIRSAIAGDYVPGGNQPTSEGLKFGEKTLKPANPEPPMPVEKDPPAPEPVPEMTPEPEPVTTPVPEESGSEVASVDPDAFNTGARYAPRRNGARTPAAAPSRKPAPASSPAAAPVRLPVTGAAPVASTTSGPNSVSLDTSSSSGGSVFLTFGLIALIILGGVVFMSRRGQKSEESPIGQWRSGGD